MAWDACATAWDDRETMRDAHQVASDTREGAWEAHPMA